MASRTTPSTKASSSAGGIVSPALRRAPVAVTGNAAAADSVVEAPAPACGALDGSVAAARAAGRGCGRKLV